MTGGLVSLLSLLVKHHSWNLFCKQIKVWFWNILKTVIQVLNIKVLIIKVKLTHKVLVVIFDSFDELLSYQTIRQETSLLRPSHFNLLEAWQICMHSLAQLTLCGLLKTTKLCVHGSFPVVGLDHFLTAQSFGKRIPIKSK